MTLKPRLSAGAVLALALTCLLVPRSAAGQFDAATVLGTVADATGAVVPGATVTLTNLETSITATTVTDRDGNFQFLNVRVGTYSLRGELQGFSTAVAPNISVAVNARARWSLRKSTGRRDRKDLPTPSHARDCRTPVPFFGAPPHPFAREAPDCEPAARVQDPEAAGFPAPRQPRPTNPQRETS